MSDTSIDNINVEALKVDEGYILYSKKVQEIKDQVFQDFGKYWNEEKDLIIINGEEWNKLRDKHGFKIE